MQSHDIAMTSATTQAVNKLASRRWLQYAALCLSLLLAQLLVISHVHADDADHGLANHDCATCIVAEQLQSSVDDAQQNLPLLASQTVAVTCAVTPPLNLAAAPYQVRAPPITTPV